MSDLLNKSTVRPVGDAKGLIDYAMRGGTIDSTGAWDPTSREATGWHGWRGLLSNSLSGEDPILSPGHRYEVTNKVWDGREGRRELGKTNAESFALPGNISRAPVQDGGLYTAKGGPNYPPMFDGDVITTRTGPTSFRNATVPGRHMFSGTIDRSFTQTPDGSIYATTIGQGRSPSLLLDMANGLLGPGIFRAQDALAADIVLRGKAPFDYSTIPLPATL